MQHVSSAASTKGRLMTWKSAIVLSCTALMAALLLAHVGWVNGPIYHKWSWQRIEWTRIYAAMALAGALFFVGQWLLERRNWPAGAVVTLMVIANISLQLGGLGARDEPFHLRRLWGNVNSYQINSYYPEALNYAAGQYGEGVGHWLKEFPQQLPNLKLHAAVKPPGQILLCAAAIKIWGANHHSSMAVGLFIAVMAGLSVAGVYAMLRFLTGDAKAALGGAGFWSLTPALIGFVPLFDQIYPLLTCGLVICWGKALQGGRWRWVIAFGLLLALALFLSYIFLQMGVIFAGMVILRLGKTGWRHWRRMAVLSIGAIGVTAAAYALFWIFTGFNPIATFIAAWGSFSEIVQGMQRPYPGNVPWDLYDAVLATGWISLPLMIFFLVRIWKARESASSSFVPPERLTGLAVLQLLIVGVLGWLPGENARLLLPMYPLLMVPIGLELKRWRAGQRVMVFGCLWVLTTLAVQNMKFIP